MKRWDAPTLIQRIRVYGDDAHRSISIAQYRTEWSGETFWRIHEDVGPGYIEWPGRLFTTEQAARDAVHEATKGGR